MNADDNDCIMPLRKCDAIFSKLICMLCLLAYSGFAGSTESQIKPSADQQVTNINIPAINDERPRIGLVLSGGGARGFAHIGQGQAQLLDQFRQ